MGGWKVQWLTLYDWRNRRISSDTMCFMSSSMSTSARSVCGSNNIIRSQKHPYTQRNSTDTTTLRTYAQIYTHTPLKAARKNTKASIWTYKGGIVINHIYLLYKFTTKWSSAKPLKWIFEKLYTFSWDWNSIVLTLVK